MPSEVNLARLNAYLIVLEMLNETDHDVSYYYVFEALASSGSVLDSVEEYFLRWSSKIQTSKSVSGFSPVPASEWNIILEEFENLETQLELTVRHWFFEQECSPKTQNVYKIENVVNTFIGMVKEEFGSFKVYRILTKPPCFYWLQWGDYVFDAEKGRFLLHFGCTD